MSDLVKRLYDEEFDTQHDVVENPFGAWQAIQSQAARIEALEAKLAKAVAALDKIKRIDSLVGVFFACERTLAELTGEKK